MSASDHINKTLFHGTRAVVTGHVINTSWSSDSPEAAREYGATKLPHGEVGPLKVYQVEPFSRAETVASPHPYMEGVQNYDSPYGYMITGEHKFEEDQ